MGRVLRDAATGDVLGAAGADRVLPAASLGKLLLLVEVARSLDLAEPLTRLPEDAVADSGLWQHLAVDTLAAGDLAALVGAVSDNLATNVLLRRVGLEAVVASAFGLDPLAHALPDRGLQLRHKTGADAGVRADAGLLGGLAYAVLARFDDARRDEVLGVMRSLGAALRAQSGSAMQAVPTRSNPSRA